MVVLATLGGETGHVLEHGIRVLPADFLHPLIRISEGKDPVDKVEEVVRLGRLPTARRHCKQPQLRKHRPIIRTCQSELERVVSPAIHRTF